MEGLSMEKKLFSFICFAFLFIFIMISSCTSMSESPDEVLEPLFFVPRNPPSAQYDLDVTVKVGEKTTWVSGSGKISCRNTGEKPMSAIALEWSGADLAVNAHQQNLMRLDDAPVNEHIWIRSLPETIAPGEELQLDIRFGLETNTRENGDVSLQRFYPKLWWEGIPTRDAFRVKLTIPDGYTAAVSGRLNPESGFYENPGVTTNFGVFLFKGINVKEREAAGI
jgi:hypothetical protein